MKAKPTELGRVVISTQGHDAGRWYAVVDVTDERMVQLCDGETRKLDKPKKKQVKHLRALPITVQVKGKGESGGPIADSDIRKALRKARDAYETKIGFVHASAQPENVKEERAFVQE